MRGSREASFRCERLSVGVAGRRLVDALQLEAAGGEFVAVLGRNGTGKTLTLHTLAGLRAADSGKVFLNGKDLGATSRAQIAKQLALLPQHVDDIFPATVLDTALIGRHPHIGRFRWESTDDIRAADAALRCVGLGEFRQRDVLTLSGGERRRLAIAQILTQAPRVCLLDEPTNHLDPQHQLDALRIFRDAADGGAIVIAALHDVNLAVRYADRCLLLYGDGRWDLGDTEDILDGGRLSELYGTPIEAVEWRSREFYFASGDVPT